MGNRGRLFDDLDFVRSRLNALATRRRDGRLTEREASEYRELCLRELTLLAGRPLPRGASRRAGDGRRR